MSEFESSPEDPWITQDYDESVSDAFPTAVDVETGKERDIEEMADPTRQGEVLSPSPVKSRTPKKTDEEKWEEYLEAYDELNKLKNKYDKKIQQHKRDFKKKNSNASKQERKEALKKYKNTFKCLKCGKAGRKDNEDEPIPGIIFNNIGDRCSVRCNALEPCNLKIELIKPNIIDLPGQIERLTDEINGQKQIITEYKLDLLFSLDDEEVILNEFQTNKDNLETMLSAVVELKEYYDKRNNLVEVPQINPDTGEVISGPFGEKIWASRKETLVKKQKELNQLISDFKRNIRLYKKENIIIGKQKILTDTLLIYKNIIVPLQNQIRELKYQKIYTDEIMDRGGARIMGEKVELMPIYNFSPMKVDIENQVMQNNDFEVQEFQK